MKARSRLANGRYTRDFSYLRVPTWLLIATVGLQIGLGWHNGLTHRLFFPETDIAKAEYQVEVVAEKSNDAMLAEQQVIASESATSTPAPLTEKQKILMYTIQVFGDEADEAIQIMKCESGYNPMTEGDKTLMSINNQTGELIGDSIGLFQIRTGDTSWNRARKEGLSVEAFREEMRNPEKNIDFAKKLYDAQGWTPWFNCMNKTGVGAK